MRRVVATELNRSPALLALDLSGVNRIDAEGIDALVSAATQAGGSVLQASDITVETSARRHGRAPHGFSQLLLTLGGPAGSGS